jgi:DNA-binding response OmpR family regulator
VGGETAPILVVDDDAVCCHLLVDVLEHAGHRVEWTTSAAIAVERLSTRRYALVISDVNMPHMLGTELAAEIAKREPRLPILLVSAFADRSIQAEARALNAMLLAKPIRTEALLAAVRALLDSSPQEEAAP